jgi:hypothetical protein
MKKLLGVILISLFLISGLSLMPYAFAQPSGQTTGSAAPMGQKAEHRERKEQHPAIHAAMIKLRAAKANLEKAAHDYGGHRTKAIEAINAALRELEEALRMDKK